MDWKQLPKSWERITPAMEIDPALLAAAKAQCRLPSEADWTDEDGLITRMLKAAIDTTEEYASIVLSTQQWRLSIPRIPCDRLPTWRNAIPDQTGIRLERPAPPNTGGVTTVDSIQYYDSDLVLQTVDPDEYYVYGNRPPMAMVKRTLAESITCERMDAVQVLFTSTLDAIPPSGEQAIMVLAAHWYRNREAIGTLPREGTAVRLSYDTVVERLRWSPFP